MNINEEMNQLGQIGSVGYAPTDVTVNDLVGRTRRTRGFRQASAAAIGSVGALALGIIGAQVLVNAEEDNAALRDRAFDNDFAFLDKSWAERYGNGYTGLGATQDQLAAAWASLQAQAAIKPVAPVTTAPPKTETPKPATTPKPTVTAACVYEEHEWEGGIKWRSPDSNCEWVYPEPSVPAGYIEFGGILGKCQTYTDVASGMTVYAAFIDAGTSWKKIVKCDGGPTDYWAGEYQYIYSDGYWKAELSGTTCTGELGTYKGAPARYSCSPKQSDWILTDPANWKKFSGDGLYHCIDDQFVWDDVLWWWDATAEAGSGAWVEMTY